MTLRRTPSALGVLHLFYKADVVVFCEGGAPLSLPEALHAGDEFTHDVLFWSSVVTALDVKRQFHFKSIGNKSTLKSLCMDVEARGIKTVTVCLDQDYDGCLGRILIGKRLAYTYGYSWENDVLSEDVLRSLFHTFVGFGEKQKSAVAAMLAQLAVFSKKAARWCEMDISFVHRGESGLFDRAKPLFCADLDSSPPCFKVSNFQRRLNDRGYVRGPKRVVQVQAADVPRVVFGKAVAHYVFCLFLHFLKSVQPKLKLQYDSFMRLAIRETCGMLTSGQLTALHSHFQSQRSAF